MNVVVFHGNDTARACILEHEFYYADKSSGVRQYDKPPKVLYKFNVSACAVVCMCRPFTVCLLAFHISGGAHEVHAVVTVMSCFCVVPGTCDNV